MAVVSREELETSLDGLAREIRDPRLGLFGPGSVAWRLGGDLATFLGGGRAVLLQLAHPMVAFAIDHHSHTRHDVAGRFERTFRNVFAMAFGDLDEAFAAARRVHAIHRRVHGTFPDAIGSWPAGSTYHANDADALRWVQATLVDTVMVVRERLGDRLSMATKDAFVREHNRFAALFGIPSDRLPASWAEHAAYMERMLASDAIAVAPCAREMANFLFGRGVPGRQPRLGRVAEALTATMLPRRLVDAFGLATSPASTAAVGAALGAIGPVYRRLPRALVMLPVQSVVTRRLAGRGPGRVALWTERQMAALTRRVTGSAA